MGVNVRSVTARLNAEVDKYIADIRRAGRETRQEFNDLQRTVRTTNDRLGVTHERLGVVTKDFRDLHQAVAPLNSSSGAGSVVALGRNMDRGGAQIDRYSGRLKLVAQATALIGPAAVPIGAIGVPAVAGLGAAVGVTAASVLTLVASFQGVGDALEALNEYQLDPTVANFEAAQDALARLAPETRRFVQEANQFRPLLDDLRDAGAEELFPGLTRSLDSLVQRAPDVQRFLAATGRELGDLAAADAASIASERWDDFFTFLAVETPPTLRVVNQIIGDLTHGASELVMALDPGSDSFLSWVGDAADGFDRWASSEQGRADIAAFLDYARENGPEVADAFVAIVDAVAQIVQAAAPIGGPVLEGITALAKVTAAIAGSDLGTPFILGLAAMSAYDRGAALLGKTWGKVSTVQTQVNGGVTSLSGNVKTLATDLNNVVRYGTLATESSKRLGSQLRTAGKAAGVVGGLAIASSGAADSIGLTNTASLALMGTMFGAPGVIAGGLIGATLDYAAANDDLESALKAVDKAQRSMDFAQRAADLETLNKEIEANEFKNQSFGNQVQDYGAWLADIVIPMGDQISTFNEQTDEGRAKAEAFMEENLMLTQRMSEFYAAVEGGDPLKNFSTDLASVQEKADTVVPALQNAGYSIEQIQQMLLTREGWDEARDAVREYVAETDSV